MILLKKSLTTLSLTLVMALSATVGAHTSKQTDANLAWSYMAPLTDPTMGIGARPGGTAAEKKAADWLDDQWKKQGYKPQVLPFSYQLNGKQYQSQNIQIDIKGKSD